MGKPQVVSDQSFEQEVLKSDTPVLVDFWAIWCGPCRMVGPVLEEIANEQGEKVKIAKLDVDANPITAGRFGVRAIPTMILFKNGREAQRIVGYQPKERLLMQIQPHITGVETPSSPAKPASTGPIPMPSGPTPPAPRPPAPTDSTSARPPTTPAPPTRSH